MDKKEKQKLYREKHKERYKLLRRLSYLKNKEEENNLGDELADVLFVIICLANQTGVDLDEALKKNFEKKALRDAERHKNNKKIQ